MWARYRNLREFDPFAYFMVNMLVFCIIMWLYGVFVLDQSSAGALLFCMFAWIGCGGCMAKLYTLCRLDEWGGDSPYTRQELEAWKHQTKVTIYHLPKKASWDELVQMANDINKWDVRLEFEYCLTMVIWAQIDRAGIKNIPGRANEYIRANPITWNVVKNA